MSTFGHLHKKFHSPIFTFLERSKTKKISYKKQLNLRCEHPEKVENFFFKLSNEFLYHVFFLQKL